MARRLTRSAGPEHPLLFETESDIPPAPIPPDPNAARELDAYRALLAEAEVTALAAAAAQPAGREVVVAGRRESAVDDAAAVLDDGTARLPLVLGSTASAALREALSARVLLVSATTSSAGGAPVLRVSAAHDLRRLGREHEARLRSIGPRH
ncbi:MAG: hypothetical protein RJQ01_02595 [Microcella sp.]|uniref:hypothetical protein n=1 Tax=Microcella sp. TaxID=1913979 RepID=UPI0033149362